MIDEMRDRIEQLENDLAQARAEILLSHQLANLPADKLWRLRHLVAHLKMQIDGAFAQLNEVLVEMAGKDGVK